MGDKWKVIFWENSRGDKEVAIFFSELEQKWKKKFAFLLLLLEETGPLMPPPGNKNLGNGLYELRDTSKGPGYRVYYCVRDQKMILLLVAGTKSSQKRDIEIATKRMNAF